VDYSSPAILSEVIYIYLARGLHGGKQHLDEGEFLEIEKYHLVELIDMVMKGKIADGKTQIAILKATRMIEELYYWLQMAFCIIRLYYWEPSPNYESELSAAIRYLHFAKQILPLRKLGIGRNFYRMYSSTPMEEETLLHCIDTMLTLLEEGDNDKIAAFADAVHNVPECFADKERLPSSFMRIEFGAFERRYGKTYLAKVWELNQPNRKRRWFRK
jgi:hypothetical protein